MTPKEIYLQDIEQRRLQHDNAQAAAVDLLDALYQKLVSSKRKEPSFLDRLLKKPPPPMKGLYLWGGVGRGKTYLMDHFYDTLPFPEKQRTHFHSFMQGIHKELKTLAKTPDPLALIAKHLATKIRVLCLDEFHVNDIGDAMLLAGFLEALFENGVTLVTTSNIPPDELYKNGLQRERFLPAIALINKQTETFHLDSPTDYRMELLERTGTYHIINDETQTLLEQQLQSLAPEDISRNKKLRVNNRDIDMVAESDDVAWFEFKAICETPRSASDYIELGMLYHTIIVSNVPALCEAQDDVAQRFIHLIDALYDHNVKTVLSAAKAPAEIYSGQRHIFAFQRTASRLQEMASEEYLSKAHRI
ncbi:cell division protein ZapE [Pseudomonadota bacterium]